MEASHIRGHNSIKKTNLSELVPLIGSPDNQLSFGRKRIITIRIFCANLTIWSMYNSFRTLVDCNIACDGSSLTLSGCAYSRTSVAGTFHLPAAFRVGSNMLVLAHPYHLNLKSTPMVIVSPHFLHIPFPPLRITTFATPQIGHVPSKTSPTLSSRKRAGFFLNSCSAALHTCFFSSFSRSLGLKFILIFIIACFTSLLMIDGLLEKSM